MLTEEMFGFRKDGIATHIRNNLVGKKAKNFRLVIIFMTQIFMVTTLNQGIMALAVPLEYL